MNSASKNTSTTASTDVCLVLMTAKNAEEGDRLARVLVDERLAACVNVLSGVRSYYRWEGKLSVDDEVMLLAKTTLALTAALEARVMELHSYSLPEVLVLSSTGGGSRYLEWVRSSVRTLVP